MKRTHHLHLSFALVFAACVAWQGLCHATDNLVANGDFQEAGEMGQWPEAKNGVSYPVEDGNRFLRITQTEPGKHVMAYHAVATPKGTAGVKMSFRVRWKDVEHGVNDWFDARIMMMFKDANHHDLAGATPPESPNFKGSGDWQTREMRFAIPEGTALLALMPSLFQAKSGVMDLDDWVITAFDAEGWKTVQSERYMWSESMPVPEGLVIPPLKVQGNRLVAMRDGAARIWGKPAQIKAGEEVWLQGVDIPSLEWTATGENIDKSVDHAIRVWGVNVIRIRALTSFWFGAGPWQNDEGRHYRAIFDQVVAVCQQQGVYVVIDLHEYRAPTGMNALFWKDAATRYANHPGVIFDLFNEPHGITWEEWRNGGDIAEKLREKEGVFAENLHDLGAVESVGMQYLVDTIRKTGARNLLSAGGLDWAYDLTGVLNGHALTDTPDGQGIMYEAHVYVWKDRWQHHFLDAAEKVPVFLGEFGCWPTRMSFIPSERHEMPDTWAPDMLGCVQKHRLHYTAFAFHPTATPNLLLDWDYTPTPYWGEPVLRALKGEQFEMKKMR